MSVTKSTERTAAAAAIEHYFETPSNYAHTGTVASLILERLPSGEHAWLRPADIAAPVEDDDTRFLADGVRSRPPRAYRRGGWVTSLVWRALPIVVVTLSIVNLALAFTIVVVLMLVSR